MVETRRSGHTTMSILRKWMLLACGLFGLLPASGGAAYPEQPISMIVAFAPGGGTDLVARALAPYIEKHIGNGARVLVVNRPGAGGEIGFTAIASAAPDGYTIGFLNALNVLTIPIERKTAFTWQSFDLLGNVVDDPGSFTVHAESPLKNLADLAAYAKANPNAVSVGTTGAGSAAQIAMLLFQKITGVQMNHIPFKGAADVRTALAGKQIVVGAVSIGEALQFAKGGAPLRILGQMSLVRTALAPDVATFKEQGVDIELASLRGMAAPRGLPAAIRERLVKAVERAVADPLFQAQAIRFYAPLRYLPPPKYEAELRQSEAQVLQLWKEMPWMDK
jgi:tripartite-type tricarboxylate transporter receptor subunit TctC